MLRVGIDCKCLFWVYQISPKRSTKEGEAVQYFDDQFFDLLRPITFFQSSSGYLHSFVLSDMNCNAELGINFFKQFLKGAGNSAIAWSQAQDAKGGGLCAGPATLPRKKPRMLQKPEPMNKMLVGG